MARSTLRIKLDVIAVAQLAEKTVSPEPFQVWKLVVNKDHSATIIVEDGNDKVLHTSQLEFTTFPEEGITLWCVDKVILLPSEF